MARWMYWHEQRHPTRHYIHRLRVVVGTEVQGKVGGAGRAVGLLYVASRYPAGGKEGN